MCVYIVTLCCYMLLTQRFNTFQIEHHYQKTTPQISMQMSPHLCLSGAVHVVLIVVLSMQPFLTPPSALKLAN